MRKKDNQELETMESDAPAGMTVSIGRAAQILGVSRSTLKRWSSEWGLRTFWDRRGRRYSVNELEAARKGLLEPRKPETVTQDIDSLGNYYSPNGYRFRVYGTGINKGYLGYFGCDKWLRILELIREKHGQGTYYLKLVDAEGTMTRYNFVARIAGVDEERQEEFEKVQSLKELAKIVKKSTRQLEEQNL